MNNKIYLRHNIIQDGDKTKNFHYLDIGRTLAGGNSYRLWISMYVQRDQQGEYISFPLKDAIITQGTRPSTLVVKHKRGYNIFNIILNDGYSYRLDSSDCNWKYYEKTNEGILVVSTSDEINVYFEEKDDNSHRGILTSNIYGLNETRAISATESEIGHHNRIVTMDETISDTLREIATGNVLEKPVERVENGNVLNEPVEGIANGNAL